MKLVQLSGLTVAVILASAAQANDLMTDASFDIHLRNYYLDASSELTGNSKQTNAQWSQAVSANFVSGFYENLIGFDLGAHYALKLKADDVVSTGNPYTRANANLLLSDNGKPGSYGKTSYAVKVNLADMGVAKYGRMFLETPLLNNNYSRSLPGLTEAFYAEGNFEGANLYGIWATKSNMRTESGFMDLMVNDKKQAVKVLGGGYDFGNGFAANLAVGQQSDVMRRYYFDAGYAMEVQGITLDSGFKFGRNSLLGYRKDTDPEFNGDDDSQNAWGLNVEAGMNQATFGLSYQKVSQSGSDFQSTWSGQGGEADSSSFFGPHGMMISDFNHDGEKSWGLTAGYDFAGMIDGLSVKAMYVKGDISTKAGISAEEKEYNLTAVYALPQVENLSVAAQYAKNKLGNTSHSSDKVDRSQVRLMVKYDLSIF